MATTDDDRAEERRVRAIDEEDPREDQRAILGAQLEAHRDSLDPASTPCRTCGGGRVVPVERIDYVSRDMATDAGAPEMEGMVYHRGEEWVDCPDCKTPEEDSDLPF